MDEMFFLTNKQDSGIDTSSLQSERDILHMIQRRILPPPLR